MWERGWDTMTSKDWGKGILSGTVNKQAGWAGEALVVVGVHQERESL
jgi:hypothetical protein